MNSFPPEVDWYRPPQFMRMGYRGDAQAFLWVAEPVRGSIFGVSFRISETLGLSIYNIDAFYEKYRKAALKELYRRIEAGETLPEGSDLEAFAWNPVVVRHDGHLYIGEIDGETYDTGNIVVYPPMPDMSPRAITDRRLALQARIAEPGMIQILRDFDRLLHIVFNKQLDAVDVDLKPGVTFSTMPELDTKNLYIRPGRFIPVDGDPSQMTAYEIKEAVERSTNGNDQLGSGN